MASYKIIGYKKMSMSFYKLLFYIFVAQKKFNHLNIEL